MTQSISSDPKPTPVPEPPPQLLGRLISADSRLSHSLHTLAQPYLPRWALLLLELSADFRLFFPATAAAAAAKPAPLLRPFLVALLLGLLLDLAAVGLVKVLVRRARPLYNRGMSAAVAADHFSFPSGHASRVFFVAALLHLSGLGFFPAAVWAWAAVTAASRVLLGRHFVLDVLAGACLGVLEGLFAFRFLRVENLL